MIDLNLVDNYRHTSPTDIALSNYIDLEELEQTEEIIKNQYINLNNLGSNLINIIDNQNIELEIYIFIFLIYSFA